jgi:hypothetical protein
MPPSIATIATLPSPPSLGPPPSRPAAVTDVGELPQVTCRMAPTVDAASAAEINRCRRDVSCCGMKQRAALEM